jgi:TolA-binding protein
MSKEHIFLGVVMNVTLLFAGVFAEAKPMSGAEAKPNTAVTNEFSKESLLIELTGKDYKKLKEEDLYAEIITAYRNNNQIAMKAHSQTFLKKYSQSSFADNVLFLQGQMALQNKSYAEALKHFQKITKNYPHSNKVVSAEFSKAVTYRRLNLPAEARRVFKDVIARYPGSPESFRAEAELKLIN